MKTVVVAGGGVLGSQIAFQAAFRGLNTKFWLRSEGSIERCKPRIEELRHVYHMELDNLKTQLGQPRVDYPRAMIDDFEHLTAEKIDELKAQVEKAYESIEYFTDIPEAVKDADVVIETIAEIPDQKKDFYGKLKDALPEHAVIATNSSTLLPSMFAEYTGRPEKYLSMHFANHIWRNNVVEVMGHAGTGEEAVQTIMDLAHEMGMIPLKVLKEQPGYLLNSLLVPFLDAGQALLVNGVADAETIDMAWKLGTGAPRGPFEILDVVGLETAYNIALMAAQKEEDENGIHHRCAAMLKKYIDEGKTGRAAGEGFYKY